MLNYNFLACKREIEGVDCETKSQYMTLTTMPQPASPDTLRYSNNTTFGNDPEWWCFEVEACDNCKVDPKTCPNKPGSAPNCSSFSTMATHKKCLYVDRATHGNAPLWPTNQADGKELKITAEPEGNTCKLEWNKICEGESNQPSPEGVFESCDFPTALQLMGYYIMRREIIGGNCATTPVPEPSDTNPPVGSTGISGSPSFTDGKKLASGAYDLTNGQKYCYRVYGYDAAGLMSRKLPVPQAVECAPNDRLPPAKPVVSMEAASGMCMPKWTAVVDKNTPVYSVYKCVGDFTACDSADKFAPIDDAEAVDTSKLFFEDGTVNDGTAYSYCVTAKDASNNVSVKFDAADKTNCAECQYVIGQCPAPGPVSAVEYNSRQGAKVSYGKSSADELPYETGEGYKIYLCSSLSPSSCASLKTPDGREDGYVLQESGTEITFSSLNVAEENAYYMGVTYTDPDVCGESKKTISNAITVVPKPPEYYCDNTPTPDDCIITIDFGTSVFKKYSLVACTEGDDCKNGAFKKAEAPLAGVKVQLVDAANPESIIMEKTSSATGAVPKLLAQEGLTGHTYKIIAKIPLANVDNFFSLKLCKEKTETDCIVELKTGLDLKSSTSVKVSINAVEIPDAASGAGGGEIGNPNCDGVINIADLGALKKSFGSGKVAPYPMCYRPWADFNMDGIVGLSDLAVVKKNFNKVIVDSSQLTGGKIPDASLCISKYDPLPSCCPKSCTQ
ncbi:MAG: hypothetical protein WCX65_07135, partial [bacterium]